MQDGKLGLYTTSTSLRSLDPTFIVPLLFSGRHPQFGFILLSPRPGPASTLIPPDADCQMSLIVSRS